MPSVSINNSAKKPSSGKALPPAPASHSKIPPAPANKSQPHSQHHNAAPHAPTPTGCGSDLDDNHGTVNKGKYSASINNVGAAPTPSKPANNKPKENHWVEVAQKPNKKDAAKKQQQQANNPVNGAGHGISGGGVGKNPCGSNNSTFGSKPALPVPAYVDARQSSVVIGGSGGLNNSQRQSGDVSPHQQSLNNSRNGSGYYAGGDHNANGHHHHYQQQHQQLPPPPMPYNNHNNNNNNNNNINNSLNSTQNNNNNVHGASFSRSHSFNGSALYHPISSGYAGGRSESGSFSGGMTAGGGGHHSHSHSPPNGSFAHNPSTSSPSMSASTHTHLNSSANGGGGHGNGGYGGRRVHTTEIFSADGIGSICYSVPTHNISHRGDMGAKRPILCRNFTTAIEAGARGNDTSAGGCPMGHRCKFVHIDVPLSSLRHEAIHTHYVWRDVDAVTYDRLDVVMARDRNEKMSVDDCSKTLIKVFGPNNREPAEEIEAGSCLLTVGSQRAFAIALGEREIDITKASPHPCHCAHYYFNQVCNRGSGCGFVHVISLSNPTRLEQTEPFVRYSNFHRRLDAVGDVHRFPEDGTAAAAKAHLQDCRRQNSVPSSANTSLSHMHSRCGSIDGSSYMPTPRNQHNGTAHSSAATSPSHNNTNNVTPRYPNHNRPHSASPPLSSAGSGATLSRNNSFHLDASGANQMQLVSLGASANGSSAAASLSARQATPINSNSAENTAAGAHGNNNKSANNTAPPSPLLMSVTAANVVPPPLSLQAGGNGDHHAAAINHRNSDDDQKERVKDSTDESPEGNATAAADAPPRRFCAPPPRPPTINWTSPMSPEILDPSAAKNGAPSFLRPDTIAPNPSGHEGGRDSNNCFGISNYTSGGNGGGNGGIVSNGLGSSDQHINARSSSIQSNASFVANNSSGNVGGGGSNTHGGGANHHHGGSNGNGCNSNGGSSSNHQSPHYFALSLSPGQHSLPTPTPNSANTPPPQQHRLALPNPLVGVPTVTSVGGVPTPTLQRQMSSSFTNNNSSNGCGAAVSVVVGGKVVSTPPPFSPTAASVAVGGAPHRQGSNVFVGTSSSPNSALLIPNNTNNTGVRVSVGGPHPMPSVVVGSASVSRCSSPALHRQHSSSPAQVGGANGMSGGGAINSSYLPPSPPLNHVHSMMGTSAANGISSISNSITNNNTSSSLSISVVNNGSFATTNATKAVVPPPPQVPSSSSVTSSEAPKSLLSATVTPASAKSNAVSTSNSAGFSAIPPPPPKEALMAYEASMRREQERAAQ